MLTETLLRIPFIVTGRCSPATTPHWLLQKFFPGGFCIIVYSITGGFLYNRRCRSLKKVYERMFKISTQVLS